MPLVRAGWTIGAVISVVVAVPVFLGCSRAAYEVAEVEGVLTIDGKPGHKMLIEFVPDIDQGTIGPISTAQTDQDGRFTLVLSGAPGATTQMGAVVGQHRVTLSDLQMAESATGAGIPVRIQPDYSLPGMTPLTQEVKSGNQSIAIDIP